MEKVLILGGGRGLGGAFLKVWQQERPHDEVVVTSRKPVPGFKSRLCDFSKVSDVESLIDFMGDWQPHRVFCFPGGGPYGKFHEKSWKDHDWALKVTLLSPMQIIHSFLTLPGTQQMVVVGSAIAETQADAFAASYSSGKHGLLGLLRSLHAEGLSKDLRLFSPGYMATDMLPNKAALRAELKPKSADDVARRMYDWVTLNTSNWHLIAP